MGKLSMVFNNFIDDMHRVLRGAAGLTDLIYNALQGPNHRDYYAERPTDAQQLAHHEKFLNRVSNHISEMLQTLIFVSLALESTRFLMILKELIIKKTALNIENTSRLAWSALLISLMICTILVSLPIFLLALASTYFVKDISLMFYFIFSPYVTNRKITQVLNYAASTIISGLIMAASTMFFIAPIALIMPVAIVLIIAFSLSIIKLLASFSLASPLNINVTQHIDIATSDFGNYTWVTHDMNLPFDPSKTVDSLSANLKNFFTAMHEKITERQSKLATNDNPGSQSNQDFEKRIALINQLKSTFETIQSSTVDESTSCQSRRESYQAVSQTIESARQDKNTFRYHACFFNPLRRDLLNQVATAIDKVAKTKYLETGYQEKMLEEQNAKVRI